MKRIEHREKEFVFPFVEYSPENMRRGLPLIIQLHGAGERGAGGDDLVLVDKHGFSSVIKDAEIDAVIVMPQCPINEFWAGRIESLYKFICSVIEYYGADEDKVSLTGLSMGGYGTWFLAMAHPELFSAIAPLCGGGMAWNSARITMPVWAFHGKQDATVSFNQTKEMVDALERLGADVKFTVYPEAGHSIQGMVYNNELLDWLISKTRKRA